MSATALDGAMTAVLSVPIGSPCCYQLAQAALKKFDWPAVKMTESSSNHIPLLHSSLLTLKGFPLSDVCELNKKHFQENISSAVSC